MNVLISLNDAPYGSERAYNGLRLAAALGQRADVNVRIFLVGDAVACAKSGQQVPRGYYNVEFMLAGIVRTRGQIGVCGTCMDARGIADGEIIEGTARSSLEQWAEWTIAADQHITF